MGVKVKQWKEAYWIFVNHRGQRKAKRVGVGPQGKKAATVAAEQIQARLALGDNSLFDDDRRMPSFQETAQRWFAAHCQLGQLRISTQALYLSNLHRYVFPRFGSKQVTEVTREDIKALVVEVLAEGKSRSLVRNIIAPVRQTFNQLVEDGIVRINPAARIGRYLKDKSDSRLRIDPLTANEETLFLETAQESFPRHHPMLLCAVRTGLRFGELVGLQWGDLDFQNRFVEVRRSLHEGGRVENPKNGKIRRVDMSLQLAAELQKLRAARSKEALAKGWGRIPEWVFCNEDGKPLWKSDFQRRVFHKVLTKAGMRRVRFHDLRHTFASRLLQNAESPVYVKDQMGHHSIKVTVDIYGHLIPGANRAAVDRLDATGRNPRATEEGSGATADAVTPRKELVELRGLEPLTPRLPALCSPN